MCSFTEKALASGGLLQTPYQGSAPGPRLWTSIPQTSSLLLCPTNNLVRLTSLLINIAALRHFRHITTQKCSVQGEGGFAP